MVGPEPLHLRHQTFDNFLTSEILRSRNPKRAVNLARLKTETYVEIQEKSRLGEPTYRTAVRQSSRMENRIWLLSGYALT